ncbi:hypothetical protein DB346_24880 [Verrucomicrobia bacterium LW23]|nr:hypothetical protein DB346_24880 [Verrucomicrobia bacterium LW23]
MTTPAAASTPPAAAPPPVLFAELFDDSRVVHDLRDGALWDAAHTRLCLAPADMLAGIAHGVRERAGEKWRPALRQCGAAWGRRVAEGLDRACQDTLKKRLGAISMDAFLRYIVRYYSFGGWGLLEMDLSLARRGIVQASLRDSLFAFATASEVHEADGMADPMTEGLLAAMLSYLSGHDLDCVQTACTTRGAEASRFIISARPRVAMFAERVQAGMSHEEIIAML